MFRGDSGWQPGGSAGNSLCPLRQQAQTHVADFRGDFSQWREEFQDFHEGSRYYHVGAIIRKCLKRLQNQRCASNQRVLQGGSKESGFCQSQSITLISTFRNSVEERTKI